MSVQSEITRLEAAKAAIADAIAEKGVDVPTGALLSDMGALIAAIESGGGGGGNAIGGRKIVTGTITGSTATSSIAVDGVGAEVTSVFGYTPVNEDYKHIAGYYDEDAKNGLVTGALYGISLLGVKGSPHYYNGSSITRGSIKIIVSLREDLWLYSYNDTYGFIPGRVYRWFVMEELL